MALCSELDALGVKLSDEVEIFWAKMASRMSESKRAACDNIAKELRDDYMMGSVGAMRNEDMWRHDMETLIEKCGGNKHWLRTVEHYLEFKYRTIPTRVPDSAALVETTAGAAIEGSNDGSTVQTKTGGIKVGEYLARRKELSRLRPPKHILTEAMWETVDWKKAPMSYNDSKRLMTAVFLWVVLTFNTTRKCILMFRVLAGYLNEEFPQTSKAEFIKKLINRWKNGKKETAKVRCA